MDEATRFPPALVRLLIALEMLEAAEEAEERAEVVLLAEVLAEERPEEVLLSEPLLMDELAAEEAAEVVLICVPGKSAKERSAELGNIRPRRLHTPAAPPA